MKSTRTNRGKVSIVPAKDRVRTYAFPNGRGGRLERLASYLNVRDSAYVFSPNAARDRENPYLLSDEDESRKNILTQAEGLVFNEEGEGVVNEEILHNQRILADPLNAGSSIFKKGKLTCLNFTGKGATVTVEGGWSSNFQYSTDCVSWQPLTMGQPVDVPEDGRLFVQANIVDDAGNVRFKLTGLNVAIHDNIQSLFGGVDADGMPLNNDTVPERGCDSMFMSCYKLESIEDLVMPATNLGDNCYYSMFEACLLLKKSLQELPATTVPNQAYKLMFCNCQSMENVPQIMATELTGIGCMFNMFGHCTSLITVPRDLLKTKEFDPVNSRSVYSSMFAHCTKLRKAPLLPATVLCEWCYQDMFEECRSLIEAPTLNALTVPRAAYAGMFINCTALVDAPVIKATDLTQDSCNQMFSGCLSLVNVPDLPFKNIFSTAVQGALMSSGSCESMFSRCYSLVKAPAIGFEKVGNKTCSNMFSDCTSLKYPPKMPSVLDADSCCSYMFKGCTSLVNAPALPATTLAKECYASMFDGCSSLTSAPALPAITLAPDCYKGMFMGCISLTAAPALPATTLADQCYEDMFNGCTSLVNAPALPATELTESCYSCMFQSCTSLTEAPVLPAETFPYVSSYSYHPYYLMFSGCTSLTHIELNAPAPGYPNIATFDGVLTDASTNGGIHKIGEDPTQVSAIYEAWKSVIPPSWKTQSTCMYFTGPGTFSLNSHPETGDSFTGLYVWRYSEMSKIYIWQQIYEDEVVEIAEGERVYVKGKTGLPYSDREFGFNITGSVTPHGNIMSLFGLNDDWTLAQTTLPDFGCWGMFAGTPIVDASDLILPDTVSFRCYAAMFQDCKSLVYAPALPATTLAPGCYFRMFYGCSALKHIEINAAAPGDNVEDMFTGVLARTDTKGGIHKIGEDPTQVSAIYEAWKDTIPVPWSQLEDGKPIIEVLGVSYNYYPWMRMDFMGRPAEYKLKNSSSAPWGDWMPYEGVQDVSTGDKILYRLMMPEDFKLPVFTGEFINIYIDVKVGEPFCDATVKDQFRLWCLGFRVGRMYLMLKPEGNVFDGLFQSLEWAYQAGSAAGVYIPYPYSDEYAHLLDGVEFPPKLHVMPGDTSWDGKFPDVTVMQDFTYPDF